MGNVLPAVQTLLHQKQKDTKSFTSKVQCVRTFAPRGVAVWCKHNACVYAPIARADLPHVTPKWV